MGSFCLGYRSGWRYSGEVVWCQSSENLKNGELRNGEGECHYAGFCVGDDLITSCGVGGDGKRRWQGIGLAKKAPVWGGQVSDGHFPHYTDSIGGYFSLLSPIPRLLCT